MAPNSQGGERGWLLDPTSRGLYLCLSSHPGTLQSVHTDWRPIYKKHKSDPVIQNPLLTSSTRQAFLENPCFAWF